MNTESNSMEPEKKTVPGVSKSTGVPAFWIVLMLALLALAAAGFALWSGQKIRLGTGARDAEIAGLKSKLDGHQNSLDALNGKYAVINDRIAETSEQQNKLNESLAALYKNQARENLDWAVAEIEHLIIIALHSLTLEHNAFTALAALQAADDRLRNLGDPDLAGVRRQLTADMNALRSVKSADITGLALYLADLVNRVETLPLKNQLVPYQPDGKTDEGLEEERSIFKKLLEEVWRELKSLVVITRTGSGSRAVLLPEEKYFLYQNLRLQLESARIAAWRRDTAGLRAAVEIVIEWIGEYFDESDTGIGNIVQSLRQMLTLELDPDLPDISSSLETLRAYIKDRSVPVPPNDDGSVP